MGIGRLFSRQLAYVLKWSWRNAAGGCPLNDAAASNGC
jgi:hypothetical protein